MVPAIVMILITLEWEIYQFYLVRLAKKIITNQYYKPSSHEGNYKYYGSNRHIEKNLSVKQYFNKIAPYLYDLINDHRIDRRLWKIQINMHVNFISSRDTGEIRTICTWSNNVSIMQDIDTNEIIKELFKSFYMIIKKSWKQLKEAILFLKVFI